MFLFPLTQLLSWNNFWYYSVLCFVQASNLIYFLGERYGIYPILPVYNSFLGACAKLHSMVHANLCLDLMDSRMVGKNEVTYTELLKVRGVDLLLLLCSRGHSFSTIWAWEEFFIPLIYLLIFFFFNFILEGLFCSVLPIAFVHNFPYHADSFLSISSGLYF